LDDRSAMMSFSQGIDASGNGVRSGPVPSL
jgi:hypothetical protein